MTETFISEAPTGRPMAAQPSAPNATVVRSGLNRQHSICGVCFKPIRWLPKHGLWVHTTVGLGNHRGRPS